MEPVVHKLALPLKSHALGHVNSYVVEHDSGIAVVDPGWFSNQVLVAFEEGLHELGISIGEVSDVLVTHAHADHCGLAGHLEECFGARIHIHPLEYEYFQRRFVRPQEYVADHDAWMERVGAPELMRTEIRGLFADRLARCAPIRRAHPLLEGPVSLGVGSGCDIALECIPSPGHSAGHVCLSVRGSDMVLTGDQVFSSLGANATSRPYAASNPLHGYLSSLNRLVLTGAKRGLPGHGPEIDDLPARVDSLRGTISRRLARLEGVVGSLPLTSFEAFSRLAANHSRPTVTLAQKLNMLGEVDALLQLLASRGRLVAEVTQSGPWLWVRPRGECPPSSAEMDLSGTWADEWIG